MLYTCNIDRYLIKKSSYRLFKSYDFYQHRSLDVKTFLPRTADEFNTR
jgi:hypothetical protein